jgi:hypothetical protein
MIDSERERWREGVGEERRVEVRPMIDERTASRLHIHTTKKETTAIKNRMLTDGRSEEEFFVRFQYNNIDLHLREKINDQDLSF